MTTITFTDNDTTYQGTYAYTDWDRWVGVHADLGNGVELVEVSPDSIRPVCECGNIIRLCHPDA